MTHMFRIGDFSKISQVPVTMLRYWDEINLLQPVYSNREMIYRQYTIEQLKQVNRIMALKGLGLPLDQIYGLLRDGVTASEIRGMLRLKQAEVLRQSNERPVTLDLVESRLKQIEQENQPPLEDVTIKACSPQRIVSIRQLTTTLESFHQLLREVERHVIPRNSNTLMVIYHDDGFYQENMDVQVGFPLLKDHAMRIPLSPGREMKVDELPGAPLLASIMHYGNWITLPQSYARLGIWIDTNGYRIAGAGREVFYHTDWQNGGHATVRELQFPIEPNQ